MPPENLTLETLGWSPAWNEQFAPFRERKLCPGRVVVEDKHHYVVWTPQGVLRAQCAGKMFHGQPKEADFPKVGDWVALVPLPAEEKGTIHAVLPRRTRLARKVPDRKQAEQVLATNVDVAFIVQALDTSYNPRLTERFLLMVREAGISPMVVLNKADLATDLAGWQAQAEKAAGGAPVFVVSARTGKGMKHFRAFIKPSETVVFVGASGVGKSSLINQLYGDDVQATTEVRESDAKGRHTTTWRELVVLPCGGLVIDTPGMREFQLWMAEDGLGAAFADIEELALRCKFTNCSHTAETPCAVREALAAGALSEERYRSFLKLKRELAFLEKAAHLSGRKRRQHQDHDHIAP